MGGKRYYSFVKGNGLIEFLALDSTVLAEEAKELEAREVAQLEREKMSINADGVVTKKEQKRLKKLDAELDESRAFIDEHVRLAAAQVDWLKDALGKTAA